MALCNRDIRYNVLNVYFKAVGLDDMKLSTT